MSRTLSLGALQQLLAQESQEPLLATLAIRHDTLPNPLRFVRNTVDIPHDGNTYTAAAFDFRMPIEAEDEISTASLVIDNVDRKIIATIRSIQARPEIDVGVLRVDVAGQTHSELGPMTFMLRRVTYNQLTIQGELGYEQNWLEEPAMRWSFDPTVSPGLL